MKLNKTKISEAEAWVERNGLYPQACGAPIKDFCAAMNINNDTYYEWCKKPEFSDALSRAREKFHSITVHEVENALVKSAKGFEQPEYREEKRAKKVKEYDPKTGKKIREYEGELIIVKATREVKVYPPSIEAAKFVLTNMAGDKWKNKQDTSLYTPDGINIRPIVVGSEKEGKQVQDLLDSDL